MRSTLSILAGALVATLFCSQTDAASYPIVTDTFIDSAPVPVVSGGVDVGSYGADGKLKAVFSRGDGTFSPNGFSNAHALISLPSAFWAAVDANPALVTSAVVNLYPFNNSLNATGQGRNIGLYPLTRAFTEGDGTQTGNGTITTNKPSTTGGATWATADGSTSWAAGGEYDQTAGHFVINPIGNQPTGSKNNGTASPSGAFTFDITSLLTNSATHDNLKNFGFLIKVTGDEGTPTGNDFASIISSDSTLAGDIAYRPFVALTMVPEPTSMAVLSAGVVLLTVRRARRA